MLSTLFNRHSLFVIRFDIITQENSDLEENSEDLCSHVRGLQRQCEKVEAKLTLTDLTNEKLTLEVNRMKATIESLREHRTGLNTAREAAIVSRDNAVKEKLASEKALLEMQGNHDEVMNEHIKMYNTLESQNYKTLQDLRDTEQKLSDKEKELIDLTVLSENKRTSSVSGFSTPANPAFDITRRVEEKSMTLNLGMKTFRGIC